MSAPTPVVTNPTAELDGLLSGITLAVAGAVTRTVTVRNRDYDGFYPGPWPLIVLRLARFSSYRISGGLTGQKGQDRTYGRLNTYTIEIQDVIDPRASGAERVAAAQTDQYALMGAILAYYDHLPNQTNPVGGVATCYRAGEDIDFVPARPFQLEDGGEVRVVAVGTISVLGLPRPQSMD